MSRGAALGPISGTPYDELVKTIRSGQFEHADTVDNMPADMHPIGANPYKIHRIYRRSI